MLLGCMNLLIFEFCSYFDGHQVEIFHESYLLKLIYLFIFLMAKFCDSHSGSNFALAKIILQLFNYEMLACLCSGSRSEGLMFRSQIYHLLFQQRGGGETSKPWPSNELLKNCHLHAISRELLRV